LALPSPTRTAAADAPTLVVVAAGAASVALYAYAASAISLAEFFPGPEGISLDWVKMLGPGRAGPAWAYLGVVIAAFSLYAAAVVATWRGRGRVSTTLLVAFPAALAVALVPMYPPTAVDLFHYHADARTLWVVQANPLVVPPQETAYPIGISWQEQPSPYGPVWSLLTAVVAPLMVWGDHHLAALLAFKVLAGAAFLGCAWMVYRLAERFVPGRGMLAFVLFAWNPFVLLRAVGNGHNDLVMMLFALLAIEAAARRDWRGAFPLLAISALIKYTTALLGPPMLLYAWAHTPGTPRERARALAPALGIAAAMTVVAYVPFWAGLDTFDTVRRQTELMITSVPELVQATLALRTDDALATAIARQGLIAVVVLIAIPVTWGSRRSVDRLVIGGFTLLFLYLVIASAWFRPWYMLWPATLVLLRPNGWGITLFFTITIGNSFTDLVELYRYDWGLAGPYWTRLAPLATQFAAPLAIWLAALARHGDVWLGDAGIATRPSVAAAAIEGRRASTG